MKYTISETQIELTGETVSSLVKHDNGVLWTIPFDPANTDYQAYLKWLSEGNTPEAADVTEVTNEVAP